MRAAGAQVRGDKKSGGNDIGEVPSVLTVPEHGWRGRERPNFKGVRGTEDSHLWKVEATLIFQLGDC